MRCVCAALSLEDVKVERSMAHLPEGDCQSLEEERQDLCRRITEEIERIKERLERKEELVEDYEKNLIRMRYMYVQCFPGSICYDLIINHNKLITNVNIVI